MSNTARQSTEPRYNVDTARKQLNATQRAAAEGLLNRRPAVVAGTRVIIDEAAKKVWFDEVAATMQRLDMPAKLVEPFCDVAGVPD